MATIVDRRLEEVGPVDSKNHAFVGYRTCLRQP